MKEILDCRDCLGMAVRRAARGISSVYDRHLRPHGVRGTQFSILVMLMGYGGTRVSVLAKALGMNRTTLTRNIAVLEAKGWVKSGSDDKDARSHIISVTDAGRAVALAALPAWRKAQDSVAGAFGPMGVAALHHLAGTAMP